MVIPIGQATGMVRCLLYIPTKDKNFIYLIYIILKKKSITFWGPIRRNGRFWFIEIDFFLKKGFVLFLCFVSYLFVVLVFFVFVCLFRFSFWFCFCYLFI